MKLIVGLGNPGARYEDTKHNVGFRVIDALYEEFCQRDSGVPRPTHTSVCNALVIQTTWHDTSIILAKPMTYMNNSGAAVAALVRRFEVPLSDLCVAYDDVHLDLGAASDTSKRKRWRSKRDEVHYSTFRHHSVSTPPHRYRRTDRRFGRLCAQLNFR